jgi:RNA polymerase primary sigma factor
MSVVAMKSPGSVVASLAAEERQGWRRRSGRWLRKEIEFIANPSFCLAATEADPRVADTLQSPVEAGSFPADLSAHLRRLCEAKLLSREQEAALFREMNQLKFRANAIRSKLDPERPNWPSVTQLESLLARAEAIRDHLILANMRLVMSIVKKFVSPRFSFDELLSDGMVTLMQAVDKFDFDRGFRFSTYAYPAIARNAYRSIMNARKQDQRFARGVDGWAFEQPEVRSSSSTTDRARNQLREMTTALLHKLDKRERFIIRSRYVLGGHRKVRTFQELADKLKISKERVRQLEQRALTKLNKMATELEMDDIFSAAMV